MGKLKEDKFLSIAEAYRSKLLKKQLTKQGNERLYNRKYFLAPEKPVS